ncbi:hypothetical protein [Brevundimonas sp. SL161]|uniref:hypothetical protein n=1 Tax=Brevundimonas sp. SL161 TaxID=2804613 RepID=UPI003CEB1859
MIAGTFGLSAPALAQAQQSPSIQEVAVVPRFADGVLQGCAVNFQVIQYDTMYAGGRPVLLDGSFQIYNFGPGRVSAVLKLGFIDEIGGAHTAPSDAYLVNGLATSVDEAQHQMGSETSGFGLFGFRLGEQVTNSIVRIMTAGKFSFAYQREGGSGGVPIEIDMSQSPEKVSDWSECIDALLLSDR